MTEVSSLWRRNWRRHQKKEIYHPYSWISRVNILKLAILPKAIYRFIDIPIKIPTQLFTHLKRTNFNFIWKSEKPRVAKNNKRTSRDINIPNFKLCYTAIVIKIPCYEHKIIQADQWNWRPRHKSTYLSIPAVFW